MKRVRAGTGGNGRRGCARRPALRIAATVLLLLAHAAAAHAESWFRWVDLDGIVRLTRERPVLSVPYTEIAVADPIRWSSPPQMPEEIAGEGKVSPQDLFRQAARSVYWIVRRPSPAVVGAQGSVYGSAVAISDDLAITNCHVVGGTGDQVMIGSGSNTETDAAELVAADVEADRCVVRTRNLRLTPVAGIRRYDTLEIGETVYAIGNPRRLERSLSDGLLSGKRSIGPLRRLQTTAPISPGSSGGGLFDSRGNLVGITTSSRRDAQNINFAIPAEDFWR